ncbi:MAG: Hpt domain-containing protein [Saprospiraceae bacterium]|nr:Hpt domain-containing protein [Saprospiraceae bacterium]
MIDLTLLRELMGHDQERVDTFLQIFASEMPRLSASLSAALAARDLEQMSTIAHAIKSQTKYLRAEAIAALAGDIEQQAEIGIYSVALDAQTERLVAMLSALLEDPVFRGS